jgi:hypothetical protein
MPAVALLRSTPDLTRGANDDADKQENFLLWLPSSLGTRYACDRQLQELEWELRFAQAHDALNEVRQNIRLSSHLKAFKRTHICGQRASTRARSMLDLADAKKMASKLKYDTARAALIVLAPILGKFAWEGSLHVLQVADLHPLDDIAPGQSEGTRDISWIWKAPGALQNDNASLQDCM